MQAPGLDAIASSATSLLLGRGLHTSPTPTAAAGARNALPGQHLLRGAASAVADSVGASVSGAAAATSVVDRWALTPQGANPAAAAASSAAVAGARRDAAALTRLLGSLSQLHALPPSLHAAACSHLASSACLLAPADAAALARVLGATRLPVPDALLRAVWTAAAPGLRQLDGKELTALAWGLLAASRGGDSVGHGGYSTSPAAWGLGEGSMVAQAGPGSGWRFDIGPGAERQLQGRGQRRGLPRDEVPPAKGAEGHDSQLHGPPPGQLPAVLVEALGAIAGRFLGGAVLPGARGADGQTGGGLQEMQGEQREVRASSALRAVGERSGASGAGMDAVDDDVEAEAGMMPPVGAGAEAGSGAGPGAGVEGVSRTAAGARAGTEVGAGANLRGLTPANLARLATAMAPAAAIASQHAQQRQAAAAVKAAAAAAAGKAAVKRRRGRDTPVATAASSAAPDVGVSSDALAPAAVVASDSSAPAGPSSPDRAPPQALSSSQALSASPQSLSASQACLDLLERVGKLSYQRVSAFKGRHLAEAAEAFATARVPYDGLFMALAHRARQLADAGEGHFGRGGVSVLWMSCIMVMMYEGLLIMLVHQTQQLSDAGATGRAGLGERREGAQRCDVVCDGLLIVLAHPVVVGLQPRRRDAQREQLVWCMLQSSGLETHTSSSCLFACHQNPSTGDHRFSTPLHACNPFFVVTCCIAPRTCPCPQQARRSRRCGGCGPPARQRATTCPRLCGTQAYRWRRMLIRTPCLTQ